MMQNAAIETKPEKPAPLPPDWMAEIGAEFDKPYMQALRQFLKSEKAAGHTIYPSTPHIFNALNTTPLNAVRVVILGQDPYHGEGQAHGLSFSVPRGVPPPPSLVNIYKEIARDFDKPTPPHGDLTGWATQGVLLLNATLTVRASEAGSHQRQGWEEFTDRVIQTLNNKRDHIVFMLWGAYAQKKGAFIDRTRHLVLTAPHPSPLSAHRGFIGCGHFSAANAYLAQYNQLPIIWV